MKRKLHVFAETLMCAALVDGLATPSPSNANTQTPQVSIPSFRMGMWYFVRTLYGIQRASGMLLSKQELTRCVNPTIAMRATFSSPDIGRCHSAKPLKIDNRFVFPTRCDDLGPVTTEIIVESDDAYTEINTVSVGNFP